jgi:hypothetical protein
VQSFIRAQRAASSPRSPSRLVFSVVPLLFDLDALLSNVFNPDDLLALETREYVPKVIAAMIIAPLSPAIRIRIARVVDLDRSEPGVRPAVSIGN